MERKDDKNRILKVGENQRKTGEYIYTYRDLDGKRKQVRSWKLNPTDKTPTGKKDTVCLRELENQINKRINSGVMGGNTKTTVKDLIDRYLCVHSNSIKESSRQTINYYYNILKNKQSIFLNKSVDKVKKSDIEILTNELSKEYKPITVKNLLTTIKSAFNFALDDKIIDTIPFSKRLKLPNNTEHKQALTPQQQSSLLEFLKSDKHYKKYYDMVYILLNTGLRVSELCGLTVNDIDLKNNRLIINKQLIKNSGIDLQIESLKTSTSNRVIPIVDNELQDCLKRAIQNRKPPKIEPMVDGVTGFLWYTSNGVPRMRKNIEQTINNIMTKYNKTHNTPIYITPHIFRHTYITNLVNGGVPIKTVQNIVGHSDITTTLNIYTDSTEESRTHDLQAYYNATNLQQIYNKSATI